MSERSNNTFNWKSFEKFFGGKFPLQMENYNNRDWVENYVQDILSNIPVGLKKNKLMNHEIFQTHNFVFTKIKVPDNINIGDLYISASSNQIKIEGLPDNQHYVIKLPTMVKARESRAKFENGHLQIKIRKMKDDQKFHDVYVHYD